MNTGDHPIRNAWAVGTAGAVAALVGLALFWNVPGNRFPGSLSDSTFYLYMADHLADFSARLTAQSTVLFSAQVFPPVFPALIGLLGGGSENVPLAHLISRVTFVLGFFAMAAWLWRRQPGWGALALGTLAGLSPTYLWVGNQLLSEGLFIAITYASLCFRARASDRGQFVLLGLMVAAAVLTRTVGAMLLVAMAANIHRHDRRKLGYFLAAALTPVVAWQVVKQLNYPTQSSYLNVFLGVLSEQGFAGLMRGVWANLTGLITAAGAACGMGWPAGAMLAVLALLGVTEDVRKFRVSALFLVGYCAIIIIWPFPAEMIRFETVIHALLLFYALSGLHRVAGRRRWPAAAAALFAAAAIVAGANQARRLVADVPPALEQYRIASDWYFEDSRETALRKLETTRRIIAFIKALPARLPADQCIYTITPHLVYHYAKLPTAKFPEDGSVAGLVECPYALSLGLGTIQSSLPKFHPLQALERPQIIAASPPSEDGTYAALLIRLPGSAAKAGAETPP